MQVEISIRSFFYSFKQAISRLTFSFINSSLNRSTPSYELEMCKFHLQLVWAHILLTINKNYMIPMQYATNKMYSKRRHGNINKTKSCIAQYTIPLLAQRTIAICSDVCHMLIQTLKNICECVHLIFNILFLLKKIPLDSHVFI